MFEVDLSDNFTKEDSSVNHNFWRKCLLCRRPKIDHNDKWEVIDLNNLDLKPKTNEPSEKILVDGGPQENQSMNQDKPD